MYEVLLRPQVRLWLAIVGTATLVLGAAYTMVQQSTRLAADDLPITTSQTIKNGLISGANPSDLVPATKTDLRNDTIPFTIITDTSKRILASSALLDGKTPLPPSGVFSFTKENGTDSFSWEPTEGVRLATYVTTYGNNQNDGFIITGQSLKQPENRVNIYNALALAAWIAVLAWVTVTILLPHSKIFLRNPAKK